MRNSSPVAIADRCAMSVQLTESNPALILLSREEVATLAGTRVRQLEDLAWKGEGPRPIKIGHRTIRYRASDVLAWLDTLATNRPSQLSPN